MPPQTGILSFGLVSIPIRIFTAIDDKRIAFHLLHEKCGSRIQNRYYCPVDDEVLEREDLVRAFEISKGKYVRLTEPELDSVEAEANRAIDLHEFIPIEAVDPVYFQDAHYLGPDEGGEKAYRLLADAMARTGRAAVAQMVSRGKEHIVLIRPHDGGLVMHRLYYADEIRDFGQVPKPDDKRPAANELRLTQRIIDRMSAADFKADKYKDEYRLRVQAMLKRKAEGREIEPAPATPKKGPRVIDLMEALRTSLERAAAPEKPGLQSAAKARRKRKAS